MTALDSAARRAVAGRKGAAARNAARPEGRARLAARYAHLHRTTLSAAAREFGVTVATVAVAWARLFPGESAIVSRRGREPAVHPEDEVTL